MVPVVVELRIASAKRNNPTRIELADRSCGILRDREKVRATGPRDSKRLNAPHSAGGETSCSDWDLRLR